MGITHRKLNKRRSALQLKTVDCVVDSGLGKGAKRGHSSFLLLFPWGSGPLDRADSQV